MNPADPSVPATPVTPIVQTPASASAPVAVNGSEEKKEEITVQPIISLQNDIEVPANAISGPGREFAPMPASVSVEKPAQIPTESFVQPTDAEPTLPQEVKDAGVEVSPSVDQPVVPQQVQSLGVQPAKDAVPVPTTPTMNIQIKNLKIDELQAVTLEKSHPVVDSVRWLGKLSVFVIDQARKAQGIIVKKK